MRYAAAIALCLALAPGAASAQQLYRWTDAAGGVHVTDTPPPPSAREVEKKAFAGSAVETNQLPFELSKAMKDAPVTLYTSPSCKDPCSQARAALNRRGIPFKEIVVWNPETNAELQRVTGATKVPTLTVGSMVQQGFEQSAFDSALDVGGYPKAGQLPARTQAAPPAPTATERPSSPPEEAQEPLGPYAPHFSSEPQK
ncbi:MAG TPA: glutaredoxin family protein [Burkholderiales bacterium]|nr:glutaredoxin family protein [Burkholderiales bacterium]